MDECWIYFRVVHTHKLDWRLQFQVQFHHFKIVDCFIFTEKRSKKPIYKETVELVNGVHTRWSIGLIELGLF